MKSVRIIHVEDSVVDQELVAALLEPEHAVEILCVQTEEQLLAALQSDEVDLIISDYSLPGYSGQQALSTARAFAPGVPFVFFSGTIEETVAIDLLTSGATDYVLKHRPQKLVRAVERALREKEDRLSRLQAEAALRAREEWYRAMTENALDIVAALDDQGRFTYLSPSVERVLGRPPASLIGSSLISLVHPTETEEAGKFLSAVALAPENQTAAATHKLQHSSGAWRDLEILGKRLAASEAAVLVLNARDVTERNQAEARYRTVFERAFEGICQIDGAGALLSANSSLARILGYETVQSLLTKRGALGLEPEDLELVQHAAAAAGFVENYHCSVAKPGGQSVSLRLSVTLVTDEQGNSLYNCFVQDITTQLAAEAEIRRQTALINEAHDAIIVTDAASKIRQWNKGAQSLYGWRESEAVGRECESLIFPQGQTWPASSTAQLLAAGRWEGEVSNRAKDGRSLVVLCRRTVLKNPDGSPQAFLILNSDVTEQKRAEANLLRAQRMESIGALAGGVAHDLNNVLAPVLMGCDILKEQVENPAALSMIATIQSSAQRGADIVRQILTFARGTASSAESVRIAPLVEEVAQILRRTFPGTIRIETRVEEGLGDLVLNPTEFHQILMNLCVNARDAMPQGGALTIEATRAVRTVESPDVEAPFLRLVVRDTGMGIPVESQAKIFEPFFTTKPEGKGTGLGLPTVLTIVRNLKGSVELESAPGKGTTFTILLPVEAAQDQSEPEAPTDSRAGAGETILFVDDEEAIIQLGKLVLEAAGYRVLPATNGIEALELIESGIEECQMVITDLAMPNLSGLDFIRELRKTNATIPVVCASGHLSAAQREALAELGVCGILLKPYSSSQLQEAVSLALLSRPAALS